MTIKKLISLTLITLILFTFSFPSPALANPTSSQLFATNCAGCHPNGSNIIRRGKNLKKKTLQKYKMDTQEAITEIITNGKNNMSAYKDRLSPEEIQQLAAYVLEQAEKDWRN
ncbi:c-type cytochrome [Ancylothrix sp. C2]|uniref:cytochrome c6 PetJ n=1 Tax=Ancylothrix sp. D3o TaxID=2953691 RepID=UPI0021BA734F|nr:c-type cytochrome [Ancylothrix sp. D3o]MCT7948648.1 c-type cytochrome [Ancylothrix sp. D3o]